MKQIFSILIVIFVVILLCGQGAQAQDGWILKSPATKPSARYLHEMASLGGDQVLLFGGYDGDYDDETWVYDLSDNTWTLKSPATQPSARDINVMASLGGDQVLLFGGSDGSGTFDDETWVYDLSDNTWTLKSPATKPPARQSHAMASLGGDQVLLFGGYDGAYHDDTWVYDLSDDTWTLKSPATKPSVRGAHAMVSLGGDQVFLFGGVGGGNEARSDDTWVYDLSDNTWTLKNPATKPPARFNHAMALLGGDQVLLFGGVDQSFYDDTWVYDLNDTTWTLKSPVTKPSERFGLAMASIGGDQVLLFGGYDGAEDDETWVYDLSDSTWTLKSPATKPVGRYEHAMASLGGDQVLLFGGVDASGLNDETWVYDLSDSTWTLKSPATKPSARYAHAIASLGGDQVLLFGGFDGAEGSDGAYDDETWVYDLSDNAWTLKSPAMKPSARFFHAMASLGGDQVLLFGGSDGANDDETWVYDLSDNTWTLKSPDMKPSARYLHAMASVGGDQVLLFGGVDGAEDDETWVYDLSDNTWTLKGPAIRPSARHGVMASVGGDQVLLFGGYDGAEDDETWVYDLSDSTWTLKSPAAKPSARHVHAMASLGGDQVLLFSGINKDDETWVYTSEAPPPSPVSVDIGPATLFMGVTNSDNNGRRIDLMVEIYKNGDLIAQASILNQQVSGNALNNSKKFVIPLSVSCEFGPTDLLDARVSIRRVGGSGNVGVRFWYGKDSTNSTSKGWSRIHKIGGSESNYYYFRDGNVLATTSGTTGIASTLTATTTYQSFGTWQIQGSLLKPGGEEITEPAEAHPATYELSQNYPNPFNPSTTIRFQIPDFGYASLMVFDMLGREVANLISGELSPGTYSIPWDASGVASGMYFYRLQAGDFVETRRLLLLK